MGSGYNVTFIRQFSDFFEEIFGGGRRAGAGFGSAFGGGFGGAGQSLRMRGEDVHARIALFLEEAFHGF